MLSQLLFLLKLLYSLVPCLASGEKIPRQSLGEDGLYFGSLNTKPTPVLLKRFYTTTESGVKAQEALSTTVDPLVQSLLEDLLPILLQSPQPDTDPPITTEDATTPTRIPIPTRKTTSVLENLPTPPPRRTPPSSVASSPPPTSPRPPSTAKTTATEQTATRRPLPFPTTLRPVLTPPSPSPPRPSVRPATFLPPFWKISTRRPTWSPPSVSWGEGKWTLFPTPLPTTASPKSTAKANLDRILEGVDLKALVDRLKQLNLTDALLGKEEGPLGPTPGPLLPTVIHQGGCFSNGDCEPPAMCLSNMCVLPPPPAETSGEGSVLGGGGRECIFTSSCPPRHRCEEMKCVRDEGTRRHIVGHNCVFHYHCPSRYLCSEDMTCYAGGPPHRQKSCIFNSSCRKGELCENMSCLPSGSDEYA